MSRPGVLVFALLGISAWAFAAESAAVKKPEAAAQPAAAAVTKPDAKTPARDSKAAEKDGKVKDEKTKDDKPAPPKPPPREFLDLAADYNVFLIAAGDKLSIQVYRESELTGVFTVTPDGRITYPLLGEIHVEGLSIDELKEYLAHELGREYLVDPQVQISIQDSPTKSVSILGQVQKPGNYILTPNLTVVRLLSQVGGFSNTASTTDVRIVRSKRNGKKVTAIIDVQAIMRGELDDIILLPTDMIYVDKMSEQKAKEEEKKNLEQVSVLGQITKPGNYDLKPGMTLIRLVSEAGGLTALADPNRVRIVRFSEDGKEGAFHVSLKKIMEGKAPDVELQPKDLIVIAESFF